ncbi:MAG: hypothetical protein K6F68_03785 [Clostridiales bacterium]|nr:hypothetical protein [Clostridiales bacterium]
MQKMPARNTPRSTTGNYMEDASPMLRLARRIREEQGVEQLRAFLAAMGPFSAPNEIRHIGEDFGIPFESIEAERRRTEERQAPRPAPKQDQGGNRMQDQMNQIGMLLNLANMMKNGGDMMNLINMFGKK